MKQNVSTRCCINSTESKEHSRTALNNAGVIECCLKGAIQVLFDENPLNHVADVVID